MGLPLPPSRPREASSLLTGVPPDSRSVSTTSPQPSFPVEILLRSAGPCACSLTPLPSLRPGLGLTTSSTSCTPRGPLSTGTLERVWRRVSSPKPGRILLPLRRITRRSALTLLRLEMTARVMNISSSSTAICFKSFRLNIREINNLKRKIKKKKKKKKKNFKAEKKKKKKKKKKK